MELTSAVLVLIALQEGLYENAWPSSKNITADKNGQELLDAWRNARKTVIHVRHDSNLLDSPLHQTSAGNAFRAGFEPIHGELVVAINTKCAFVASHLDQHLRMISAQQLVVFGKSLGSFVSSTARTAVDLGWKTVLVEDACDSSDLRSPDGHSIPASIVHDVHVASLAMESCAVAKTRQVIDALKQQPKPS
jgi:nicotinamidase-related amidase